MHKGSDMIFGIAQQKMDVILHKTIGDKNNVLFRYISAHFLKKYQIVHLFFKDNLLAYAADNNMVIAGKALSSCISRHDFLPSSNSKIDVKIYIAIEWEKVICSF
jgi:hypothetical protein